MAEVVHFEASRFPSLIPFIRGSFKVTMPVSNDIRVSANYKTAKLRRWGRLWVNICMFKISAHSTLWIPVSDQDRVVLDTMRETIQGARRHRNNSVSSTDLVDSDYDDHRNFVILYDVILILREL